MEDVILLRALGDGLGHADAPRGRHVLEKVRASDLVTTLPRRLLLVLGAAPDCLFPPPVALAPLRVRAIWHSRSQADEGVAWLRETLAAR